MGSVTPHFVVHRHPRMGLPPVERQTILIVDDEEGVRSILARWLESTGYRIVLATGADAALACFEDAAPAVMICDIRMPGRDGLWLAGRVRQDYPETAVIISSGVQDVHAAEECLRQGVVDYLTKPFGRDRLREAVQRGLEWHEAAAEAGRWKRQLDEELRERKAGLLRTIRSLTVENDPDVEALLSRTVTQREAYAHAYRVQFLAVCTAKALALPADEVAVLARAALLHEIGKAALPLALVQKPAALLPEELALVRTYPAVGASVLSEVPFLKAAAPLVRDAHERMDGHGFPHRVAGTSVSLAARILGVVDAYDAMTHARVFRDGISQPQAMLEVERCSGSQFDPVVVRAFRSTVPR
jgi:putative two-component system response regulator